MENSNIAALEGRMAMVTGASGGIGQVVSVALAQAGADVVLAGRNRAPMEAAASRIKQLGRRAHIITFDALDPESVEPAVAAAEDALGPMDIAVAGSAISGPAAPLWEYSLEDWQAVINTNLTGSFMFCQAALRRMVQRKTGSIVVIGSIAGKRPSPGRGGYSASKAGLIALVRAMAVDAGPHGVRSNMISPGAVAGDNLAQIVRESAEMANLPEETVLASYRDAAPMRALVNAKDVANAVVFLSSDGAAHITGADLNVTAGLVMH